MPQKTSLGGILTSCMFPATRSCSSHICHCVRDGKAYPKRENILILKKLANAILVTEVHQGFPPVDRVFVESLDENLDFLIHESAR